MKKPYRDSKSSGFSGARGGRKPAGGGYGERKSFGSDSAVQAMHKATCAECGNTCEVPFKPNGRKPVLCSMCFKKDGADDGQRPRGASFGKPSFNDRRAAGPQSGSFRDRNTSNQGDELRKINAKLDAILKLLA